MLPQKTKASDASTPEISRRSFVTGTTAGMASMLGFSGMVYGGGEKKLANAQKRVVVFWLGGGVSQLESWDPKTSAETSGPFAAIPTSVPGIQIGELLPHTARQMHHLALVRGISFDDDVNCHGRSTKVMHTGFRTTPGFEYPSLGSALSSLLIQPDNPLPGYIYVGGRAQPNENSFLGPRFAPLNLSATESPKSLVPPEGLSSEADVRRRKLRDRFSKRFSLGRSNAQTEAYDASYDQAAALVARRDVFDFSTFDEKDLDRYGRHEFGRHCLMARRLVEAGVPFLRVEHGNYDTHANNFNFHIQLLGEFDRPFATFVSDLEQNGLLEHTTIIVMSEFGRTPKINPKLGRDHWGKSWSIALGGAGIQGGAVVGKTSDDGVEVVDRKVDVGHLFHTFYQAVGLDAGEDFIHNDRPFHRAEPETEAISEVLV